MLSPWTTQLKNNRLPRSYTPYLFTETKEQIQEGFQRLSDACKASKRVKFPGQGNAVCNSELCSHITEHLLVTTKRPSDLCSAFCLSYPHRLIIRTRHYRPPVCTDCNTPHRIFMSTQWFTTNCSTFRAPHPHRLIIKNQTPSSVRLHLLLHSAPNSHVLKQVRTHHVWLLLFPHPIPASFFTRSIHHRPPVCTYCHT